MLDKNSLLNIPNLLLIAGQNQNVGKTTLACRIISNFSRIHSITAFKISPHFHNDIGTASVLESGAQWQILKETSTETNKDTSRMLQAGADQSFLMQAEENSIYTGFLELLKYVPAGNLIVCESAGVREFIQPGIFLVLRQLSCRVCSIEDAKLFQQADRIVTFTLNGFDFSIDELIIAEKKWELKKH